MRISDWSSDVCSSDLLLEQAVHDARAARVGQEFAVIADQPARRRREGDPGLAAARWPHVGEFRLPHRHLFDDGAGMLLVHVDDDGFIRFFAPAAFAFAQRSEEHTSELQSLMRISTAVFCLKKKKHTTKT